MKDFLGNFYDGFVPRKSIATWWYILINHRLFFSNYLAGNVEKYEKPGFFLFASLSLYILISSVGSYFTTPSWANVVDALPPSEIRKFEEVFNITIDNETVYRETMILGSSDASRVIKSKTGSIDLEKISDYLSKKNEYRLAHIILRSKGEENKIIKYAIFFLQIVLPLFVIFQSRIIHEFISEEDTEEKRQESLSLFVYLSAFIYPFFAMTEVITWLAYQNELIVSYMRFLLIPLIIWKVGDTYNYIYKKGIISSYLIITFSSFIIVVPLFFLMYLLLITLI